MKSAFQAAALTIGGLLASGCVVHVDTQAQIVREEKRFTVDGMADLHLATFDGTIEVQSWDKPDIVVEIEKRGPTQEAVDALQITATQQGNRIELEVKRPRSENFRGIGLYRSASARLIVSVPGKTNVSARSGDGSIRIERVSGRIEVRTGDGSIRGIDLSGDLSMNTGDGSVTIDGAAGRLEVDTGDGGVEVTGRLTRLKVHTGDGSIVCRAEPDSRMAEDWEITTGDGSVTLFLPSGLNAELDAHTGDGSIRNELQLVADGDRGQRRRTLKARLGDGGKHLRIRTGDGSIRLRITD